VAEPQDAHLRARAHESPATHATHAAAAAAPPALPPRPSLQVLHVSARVICHALIGCWKWTQAALLEHGLIEHASTSS
jgi:hypothetical protein